MYVMFSNMYKSMPCIKIGVFIIKLDSEKLQVFCVICLSVSCLCACFDVNLSYILVKKFETWPNDVYRWVFCEAWV